MFDVLRNFSYEDVIPDKYRDSIKFDSNKNKKSDPRTKTFFSSFLNIFVQRKNPDDIKAIALKIIGRDSLDDKPLTREEIEKIERWAKENQMK
jgi:hypothetical protein